MAEILLVTGAQGFIGRYLCAAWLERHPDALVVGVGRSPARIAFTHRVTWGGKAVPAPLPASLRFLPHDSRYSYVSLDLNHRAALDDLLREVRPSQVIHMASALMGDPETDLAASNVAASTSIMEAVSAFDPRVPVVLGSSGSVYGRPTRLPVEEDEPCAPLYAYARSKLAAERLAGSIAAATGTPLMLARIFNPVGAGQDERHLAGHLASQCAAIIAGLAPPQVGFGPLSASRDFVDVREVAAAICLLAERAVPGGYNVGSGVETSGQEVWEKMRVLAEARGLPEVRIQRRPARPVDVPRLFGSTARLRALGHHSRISLEDGLAAALDWYLSEVAQEA